MLKFSLLLIAVVTLFAELNQTRDEKELGFYFNSGVRDYRIGSYYDALNEFNHLAKRPQNPFYLPSLLFLAKTYLQIGKRTGEKKYLWSARNYLNTYLAKGGKENSDYYYTKALIFEILGFYERALSNYKISLKKAKNKKEQLQAIIGILRSAVWLKKLDLATKYIVILNIEHLTKEQKREFLFLKGMYNFVKGDYKKAIGAFEKSYREYESFLIENPEYYYIVAETIYRLGDLNFSQRLFRRILNYVKNREVIQKSLLRLGDINFQLGQIQRSASYYYRLIRDFPGSRYSLVAKLKILYLMKQDQRLAYYIKKFMQNAQFLVNPQKFVIETLVKNRNNYIGIFALANFGKTVFDLDSDKLYRRLGWELSLISIEKLKFEHKEYFKRVWSKELIHLEAKRFCRLYRSNPEFFFSIFDRDVLLKTARKLERCHNSKVYIDFYKKLTQRFPNDEVLYRLVTVLFEKQRYREAVEYLKKIKHKDCRYKKWEAKLCYMQNGTCQPIFESYVKSCSDSLYKPLFSALVANTFINDELLDMQKLKEGYKDDPVVRKFVRSVVDKWIEENRYVYIIRFLSPLSQMMGKDCYLKSILALSYVRSGKIELAKRMLDEIGSCKDTWFLIALNALKDSRLQMRIKNVGQNR